MPVGPKVSGDNGHVFVESRDLEVRQHVGLKAFPQLVPWWPDLGSIADFLYADCRSEQLRRLRLESSFHVRVRPLSHQLAQHVRVEQVHALIERR